MENTYCVNIDRLLVKDHGKNTVIFLRFLMLNDEHNILVRLTKSVGLRIIE